MCRLLFVKSGRPFDSAAHLRQLSELSKNSTEYQGHGWGCAYLRDGEWKVYKNIRPIWEDDLSQFPSTVRLLAHARSAFQNEDLAVENNMPFFHDDLMFIFNGELHGVRIKETGRIGAEKIFNVIRRFYRGDMESAVKKGTELIQKRTRYVKAMNLILSDKEKAVVASIFNESPDYFTLHHRRMPDEQIVCSEPYPGESGWEKIENRTIGVF